jgi:hypothetical protein
MGKKLLLKQSKCQEHGTFQHYNAYLHAISEDFFNIEHIWLHVGKP